MSWPEALVHELAARRCIVFLGAGASAAALAPNGNHPPTWKQFLEILKSKVRTGEDLSTVNALIENQKYLDAAEILYAKIPPADFTRALRETLVVPNFSPSAIHDHIVDIDPKIVVTTNFDTIYEDFCRKGEARAGYNVCKYYESHLVNDLRSPIRLIVKAHGCVTDSSKVILTRSQFFRERQNNSYFYKVLDALFLTHTVLFVGYSMTDPDIQLVLENASMVARSTHPHYALIQDDLNPDVESAICKSYNLEFIKYPFGMHAKAELLLSKLRDEVRGARASNPA